MSVDDFMRNWLEAPRVDPPRLVRAPLDKRHWQRASQPGRTLRIAWIRPEVAHLFPNVPVRAPGRSPRSSSRGRQTRVFCQKSGRSVRGASRREGLHVLDADFDPEVTWFCEQPMKLAYGDGRHHRPDALVILANGGMELREVKSEADAAKEEGKWREIGETVSAAGLSYRVVTEGWLEGTVRSGNISLIMPDRHVDLPEDDVLDEVWDWMGERWLTPDELEARFPVLDRAAVHSLIRKLFLSVESLDREFDGSAPIRRHRRKIKRIGGDYPKGQGEVWE